MSLAAGTQLGPYEILELESFGAPGTPLKLAPVGAGGTGEVYRAKDTKRGREVAIKVLPDALAHDMDRMARFERRVKMLASLNHPNLASIYGLEGPALVMELVEGETLAGPLPLDTALTHAREIAEALEYAHERGVIHRDLKPASVKVKAGGVLKLLDFGLGKAMEDSAEPASPANAPTLTLAHTRAGRMLGIAAYLSPEQALGEPADRRSDIFSFGAIFYEMLSGKQAFTGESMGDALVSVLEREPDWGALPPETPPAVVRLLQRCLTKDRKQRLQAIGEARIALEHSQNDPSTVVTTSAPSRLGWVLATVGVATLALAAPVVVHFREPNSESRPIKLSVTPPDNTAGMRFPAVSPDGRRVAFLTAIGSKGPIWIRDLDALTARPLAGTDGGRPFSWSPDSSSLAFVGQDEKELKKVNLASGQILTVFDARDARIPSLGSWSRNGVILFEQQQPDGSPGGDKGLLRIPDTGGTPALVTAVNPAAGEIVHTFPSFLPDGRHFLYTVANKDPAKSAVYVGDVESKTPGQNGRVVIPSASNAMYSPAATSKQGYVLFVRDRKLLAQPFDPDDAKTTGDPAPLADQIGGQLDMVTAHSFDFSVSQSSRPYSVLAYDTGAMSGRNEELVWRDRTGKKVGDPIPLSAGDNSGPRIVAAFPAISPDGSRVAFVRGEKAGSDIWLRNLSSGGDLRFTANSRNNLHPVWSPDSTRIAFSSDRDGNPAVYEKLASGVAKEQLLDKEGGHPADWSRDGRYILEERQDPRTLGDIWLLPFALAKPLDKVNDKGGDRRPLPYLNSWFNEHSARLSPNGQWLAYASDVNKRSEVYVESFPKRGAVVQVSTAGGEYPVWSRDGKELYFEARQDQKMMAVQIGAVNPKGSPFSPPKAMFDVPSCCAPYDVGKDGRFLIDSAARGDDHAPDAPPMTVVVNWADGLKK